MDDGTEEARTIVHEAYLKSGGPTDELRRVYQAYLDNEKRLLLAKLAKH